MKSRFKSLFCTSGRATRLGLFLAGLVLILSWFHPVWIFNLFLVARIFAGVFFPQFFQPSVSQIIPTVYL